MFAWLLLYVYVLVDVLGFVIVLFQSGVFEHVLCSRGCCHKCMFWVMFLYIIIKNENTLQL